MSRKLQFNLEEEITSTAANYKAMGKQVEDGPNSKRPRLENQGSGWSDPPREIVECIIGRLHWIDRVRIQAVCKAWAVPNRHIPTIDNDKIPWAMTNFSFKPTDDDQIYGDCRLLDPLSPRYVAKGLVRGKESCKFPNAIPCASVYGWVLFQVFEEKQMLLFLYSPFTNEVIKLPELKERPNFQVATFSLNASSPKCVVFLLRMGDYKKIYIKLCSLGDYSWKTFEFNNGLENPNLAVDAVYSNGNFYCLFARGQLGSFNVELEEWSMLADHRIPNYHSFHANLIASDSDLRLLDQCVVLSVKVFKFDFSKMHWVYENNLNNHLLFIGNTTSFYAPAVGETSELANLIFSCNRLRSSIRCYGSTISSGRRRSLLYRKCVEATKSAMVWIKPPLGGSWRANDLLKALPR